MAGATRYLKFAVGIYCLPNKCVEILVSENEILYKILEDGSGNYPKIEKFIANVPADLIAELDRIDIPSWNKNYTNSNIVDGERWWLDFYDGKIFMHKSGFNDCPLLWKNFIAWLDKVIPEIDFSGYADSMIVKELDFMKRIVVIPGDGIGAEVTASAVEVLKKVDAKFNLELEFEYRDAGGASYEKFGEPLTAETLDACKKADAILFGAVGGKQWDNLPVDKRPEKALFGLRKGLGLYGNLRPVKVYDALIDGSPLKPELVRGADLLIVRELVGGIYFGARCESETVDGVERAWDTEMYSVPEIERIARLAFELAQKRRHKVTSVDKANVLASSRLWRRVVTEVAKNYPDVELDMLYVDAAAMMLAVNPRQFDVIVTSNMFGDILSDEAAVIGGSIGLLPSASLGEGTGFFEQIAGSAPDIAGKNLANPIAEILSAAMLLRFSLDAPAAADAIEKAVDQTLADGYRTAEIYRDGCKKVGTVEMTDAICARI